MLTLNAFARFGELNEAIIKWNLLFYESINVDAINSSKNTKINFFSISNSNLHFIHFIFNLLIHLLIYFEKFQFDCKPTQFPFGVEFIHWVGGFWGSQNALTQWINSTPNGNWVGLQSKSFNKNIFINLIKITSIANINSNSNVNLKPFKFE